MLQFLVMKFILDKFMMVKVCHLFFIILNYIDRLIVMDGWSKTYAMTGWRLGWSVWPKSLIENVTKMAINSYSCVSAANQVAALAALEGSHEFINDMMKKFDKRRNLIVDGLNSLYQELNVINLVEHFMLSQILVKLA